MVGFVHGRALVRLGRGLLDRRLWLVRLNVHAGFRKSRVDHSATRVPARRDGATDRRCADQPVALGERAPAPLARIAALR